MASTSRYLKVSSSVLMEYIYTDPSLPQIITTTTAPWFKMVNDYDSKEYYFNDDNSAAITGNVRDRSAALIDTTLNKFAYLNIDEIRAYNDIDNKLTDSGNLQVGFTASDPVEYDTIRIHLIQGFNFEENEGFLLEAEFARLDDKISKILSLVYLKQDSFETLNPNPFLFAGRSYTSYIDVKIPSLRFLIEEYKTEFLAPVPDTDILSYKMSGGLGFRSTDSINFRFGFIDRKERFNGNDFFYVTSQNEFSLPKEDQYGLLGANVSFSTSGDYINIYGTYDGIIYEDFVDGLNNDGGDYVSIHQIVVSEQLGIDWVTTQVLEIQQTDNFDEPIKFRPIIENNNAVAYKIDYVLRLLNRNDNSTILRTGSLTSTNVAKYGRSLAKINLGTNPVIAKVYNKVFDNVVNFSKRGSNEIPKPSNYRRYVTSFYDISNLVLNSQTVYIGATGNIIADPNQSSDVAWGQGTYELVLSPFDSLHKFTISDRKGFTIQGKDLSGVGLICLNFKTDKGDSVCIEEEVTNQVNKAIGEVLFKIDTQTSENIMDLKNRTFYITSITEEGVETLIYTGTFLPASEFTEKARSAELLRLANLNSILTELRTDSVQHNNRLIQQIKKLGATPVK